MWTWNWQRKKPNCHFKMSWWCLLKLTFLFVVWRSYIMHLVWFFEKLLLINQLILKIVMLMLHLIFCLYLSSSRWFYTWWKRLWELLIVFVKYSLAQFRVDIFFVTVDKQLQKLNDQFSEQIMKLLTQSNLISKNDYKALDIELYVQLWTNFIL